MIPLCHLISLFDCLHVDGLTTLHECHCRHQLAHGGTIFVLDLLGRLQPRFVANGVDVPEGVVFRTRSPCRYYRSDGVFVIPSDVSTED